MRVNLASAREHIAATIKTTLDDASAKAAALRRFGAVVETASVLLGGECQLACDDEPRACWAVRGVAHQSGGITLTVTLCAAGIRISVFRNGLWLSKRNKWNENKGHDDTSKDAAGDEKLLRRMVEYAHRIRDELNAHLAGGRGD